MGLEDFFNLLVGEDSSTVDPEILRGPDAANNISDDQVIDLVNLLEFKPRYGPAPADKASDERKRLLKQRMAVARRVQASLSSYGRSPAQYSRFDSLEK